MAKKMVNKKKKLSLSKEHVMSLTQMMTVNGGATKSNSSKCPPPPPETKN
jgi:hypothetical protein